MKKKSVVCRELEVFNGTTANEKGRSKTGSESNGTGKSGRLEGLHEKRIDNSSQRNFSTTSYPRGNNLA
jgi:hypothetical protein